MRHVAIGPHSYVSTGWMCRPGGPSESRFDFGSFGPNAVMLPCRFEREREVPDLGSRVRSSTWRRRRFSRTDLGTKGERSYTCLYFTSSAVLWSWRATTSFRAGTEAPKPSGKWPCAAW